MRLRKYIFFISYLIALLCMISCARPRVISSETKTEVSYKDTTISVKGDMVKASITDSLLKELLKLKAEGKKPEIIYRNNPASPTNLTVHLDDKGNIQADCKTDDQLIQSLIKEIKELKSTKEVVKETPQWMMWGMLGIILLLLIEHIIKFFK